MSFAEFKNQTRSQKVVLVTLESKKQFKVFSLVSGTIYEKSVGFFVVGVNAGGVSLEQTTGTPGVGQFSFNAQTGKVTLNTGVDPVTQSVFFTFRHFFSTLPAALPYDLNTGSVVDWEPRIKNDVSDLKLELDYENTGIALETSSNAVFINTDGFFDPIFDTHIFEGQAVRFYTWGTTLLPSEAKLIYRGTITDKAFSTSEIRFTFKDSLSVMRQVLQWSSFQESDFSGKPNNTVLGKPKRLVFGTMEKLRTTSLDVVGSGYTLTGTVVGDANRNLLDGTVQGTSGGNTLTGTGTFFTSQLAPGNRILVQTPLNEYTFTVSTITNDLSLTITGTFPASFLGASIRNLEVQNNIVDGTGTDFINELSPGDSVITTVSGVEYTFTVDVINSATQFTITEEIEATFFNVSLDVVPFVPWRQKNRVWHIAAHGLHTFTMNVTAILDSVTIEVDDPKDLRQGDRIDLAGRAYIVNAISGLKIRLNVSIPGSVTLPQTASLIAVPRAYIGQNLLTYPRDYSIVNTSTESRLVLSDLAEFNIARTISSSVQLQFTNGSDQITLVSTDVDLTSIFKTRDWIRPRLITEPAFYEILSVTQNTIKLRAPYVGQTFLGGSQRKSPEFASDDTLLTVDCKGLSEGGVWKRTASQAVQYIIEQGGVTDINQDSFDQAVSDCQFDLSIAYPFSPGGEFPDIRKMVTDINQSVFGSLYLDNEFSFRYSILNSDKPETLTVLGDDDILGFSVSTKNNIKNRILMQYRPSVDLITGQDVFKQIDQNSEFVDTHIGQVDTLNVTCFLYDDQDALTIAERWLFFRSLSQSVVTLNAKLEFIDTTLNDVVALNLDRLFNRYGGQDRFKIGLVNLVSKDGQNSQVRINDLGNILNRVGAIAPDDQPEYLSASRLEIAKWTFIVDNETETPDLTENELGNNLIG